MKNTKIRYLYRDGDNYKYTHTVIVRGRLAWNEIKGYLDGLDGFVPYDVGLHHPGSLLTGWPNESDHPWCEVEREMIEETDAEPTTDVTASELLERFRLAHEKGWPGQGRPY